MILRLLLILFFLQLSAVTGLYYHAYGGGDPHFKTWSGHKFDYHGVCDLVLAQSNKFGSGKGLDFHIRTKRRGHFSYISDAALKIGDDTLEVGRHGHYVLNGVENADMPNSLSGFPVSYSAETDGKRHHFRVDLGKDEFIHIKVYQAILFVTINSESEEMFGDSKGLLGEFGTGKMMARDGTTELHRTPNEFGQEWQVLSTEPQLFQTASGPQHPAVCEPAPPKDTIAQKRRRLGESLHFKAAEEACAHWGEDMDMCIFDVLETGDLEIASAGAY